MISELVQAVGKFIQSLDTNELFDLWSIILSAISTLVAILVLCYNHKAIKLTQKGMQQTLNLVFYEKMLSVANNIEKGDFSNTDIEIKLLFGDTVLQNIHHIIKLNEDNINQEREIDKYLDLFNRQQEAEEYNNLNTLLTEETEVLEEHVKRFQELDKRLNVLYSSDGKEYDWKKISERHKQTQEEIKYRVKKVKDDIWEIMKAKLSI